MTKLFHSKPFIIAEIGSNWSNFNEAKDSISFAKACGADAVKFQLFTEGELFGPGVRGSSRVDITELDVKWLPKLKEKADACGIEFMCTAFSPAGYDIVDPFVEMHKIASSEVGCPFILEKVKSKGKPILASVGGSNKGDLAASMDILRGGPQVVLMYCCGAYPSKYYNLFQMKDLADTFKVPVGLSDHSNSVAYTPLSAVHHFGVVVVEKHVSFFEDLKTPDSPHSLDHDEFSFMCQLLKGKRPYKEFNPQPEEYDMFHRHNRRLIAIKDIKKGDAFRLNDNFGSFRSLVREYKAITAFAWENVAKSTGAKRDIKAGEGIGPGDF